MGSCLARTGRGQENSLDGALHDRFRTGPVNQAFILRDTGIVARALFPPALISMKKGSLGFPFFTDFLSSLPGVTQTYIGAPRLLKLVAIAVLEIGMQLDAVRH